MRKNNKHLPPNVYFKHGAYYYVKSSIINGKRKRKWTWLGATFNEAMAAWAKIFNTSNVIISMNDLFLRYMAEIAPKKSEASYKQNLIQMQNLIIFFGELKPEEVTPVDVYRYLDLRALKVKVAPNREKALLSHVFSMAIRWGIAKDNPCRHVKRLPEKPRKRYITEEEFLAVRSISPPIQKCLMDFAYLTGQRISDILKIKIADLLEEGILIKQNKTGSEFIIRWSDDLRNVVKQITDISCSNIYSFTLFCNRNGQKISYSAFKSAWKRTMKKALENNLIKTDFRFHDLRAKTGSDAEDINHASNLLGHKDTKITERVYSRKMKMVKPLK